MLPIKFCCSFLTFIKKNSLDKIMSFLGKEIEAHFYFLYTQMNGFICWVLWHKWGEGCLHMQNGKNVQLDPALSVLNLRIYFHQLSCPFTWIENRKFEITAINKWIGKRMNEETMRLWRRHFWSTLSWENPEISIRMSIDLMFVSFMTSLSKVSLTDSLNEERKEKKEKERSCICIFTWYVLNYRDPGI